MVSSSRMIWEAQLLALAERVALHLSGHTSHRLAVALEMSKGNLENGIVDEDDRIWIKEASVQESIVLCRPYFRVKDWRDCQHQFLHPRSQPNLGRHF